MNPRKRLFLWSATFGLIAGIFVFFVAVAPKKEGSFERVAAAARDIQKGEFLRQDMVEFVPVDSRNIPDDAMRQSQWNTYGGHQSDRNISAGEILRTSSFHR